MLADLTLEAHYTIAWISRGHAATSVADQIPVAWILPVTTVELARHWELAVIGNVGRLTTTDIITDLFIRRAVLQTLTRITEETVAAEDRVTGIHATAAHAHFAMMALIIGLASADTCAAIAHLARLTDHAVTGVSGWRTAPLVTFQSLITGIIVTAAIKLAVHWKFAVVRNIGRLTTTDIIADHLIRRAIL